MPDVHIKGVGLAGILIADALEALGAEVVLTEGALAGAASPIAPGILNPLMGRAFQPTDEVETLLAAGGRAYRRLAERLGVTIWHDDPVWRLFRDAEERAVWQDCRDDPRIRPFVERELSPTTTHRAIEMPHGGFVTARSGWLDLPLLLSSYRAWAQRTGRLVDQRDERVKAAVVVEATGWRASLDPKWGWLPWSPARGEMLTVRITDPGLPQAILHQGHWLQPLGEGLWRAGATYGWTRMDDAPTLPASLQIQQGVRAFLKLPFTVVSQSFGVRPILRDYKPVAGSHPDQPNVFILNGFGTKGVMVGPWAAEALAVHIRGGAPLPAEIDLRRFDKKAPGVEPGAS